MTVFACRLPRFVLVGVTPTLCADVCIADGGDKVLEMACGAGLAVFWGYFTLSREQSRKVLAERGVALARRTGDGARGAQCTGAAGNTDAGVKTLSNFAGVGRGRSSAHVCLERARWFV